MSLQSKATTAREVYLISAGSARGNRQALMRAARLEDRPLIRRAIVRSARDFNRDVLLYLRWARIK